MDRLDYQPEDFKQWFGRFVTTPRHELDIAPAQPPYDQDEIVDALMEGAVLTRLGGLRVLRVGDNVFINSERLEMANAEAADALCRYTIIGKKELGEALQDSAFVTELTELINQGYWFFNE
ncbi:putative cytoplasmic protein [Yersinia pestis Pestoides A]|nr:putative cytoplasmic protein [Yersinia pestis Pestoides A]